MLIGSVVESIKGRDKNKFYVVTKIENDYCYLVNGKDRPFQKSKRKNLKHLKLVKENFINFKDFKNSLSIDNKIIEMLKMYN